ncbi:MAG TPA: hypothetical protein VIQ51_08650 [Chryseosolibacter sp.]
MPCYSGYIEIDDSITSRSGLYAVDLPGVESAMFSELLRDDHSGTSQFHNMILKRAWTNMVSDISIALQDKFFVDSKILSRETSKFKEGVNANSRLAGVKFEFDLPRYARIHVLSVGVYSAGAYLSPEADIYFYEEDEDGELLYTEHAQIEEGRTTINIDRDFEVDKLFIAYDPTLLSFRETENRHYNTFYNHFDKLECTFPCAGLNGHQGIVRQVNGGGLNVKFSVVCSVEKFVCENINLFKTAFWYRYGVELMDEALLGSKLNRFTTMTTERATERSGYFGSKYTANIGEAIKSQNVKEDPICFRCKPVVMSKTIHP